MGKKPRSEWECWRAPDLDYSRIYHHGDKECTVIIIEGDQKIATAITLLLQASGATVQ